MHSDDDDDVQRVGRVRMRASCLEPLQARVAPLRRPQTPGYRGVPPCGAVLACLLSWAPVAHAQTDEIQVYDAEITAPGRINLTWHNNFTPSAAPGRLSREASRRSTR